MPFLRSRIARLESQSDLDISYEAFIRFIHNKDAMSEKEIHHIESSRRYQAIINDLRR